MQKCFVVSRAKQNCVYESLENMNDFVFLDWDEGEWVCWFGGETPLLFIHSILSSLDEKKV
jgi:hypothetical protein